MRRRSLLASLATGLAASAGCLAGDDSPGTSTGTKTYHDTNSQTIDSGTTGTTPKNTGGGFAEPVTLGDTTLELTSATTQHSYFHLTSPDTMGVEAADGQFFFVGVRVTEGDAPGPDSFDVRVGDETYDLTTSLADRDSYDSPVAAGNGQYYTREEGAGWLATDVPAPLSGETLRIRIEQGEATAEVALPNFVADGLAVPSPDFAFGDVSIPDSVGPNDPIKVELPVTNEGDGRGTARVVVNEVGPMYAPHRVEADLGAGKSTTLAESIPTDRGGSTASEVRLHVVAPGVDHRQTVTVDSDGTTTEN
ncbi:hypothetical protein [Haloarchaeobius sp. TZWWS8]|uniref:hypothetical protein n=1 Tax=Haloarchaeobius sp. TZWWS8 TaxID=3446121 RepID=UPI003EBA9DA3